MFFVVFLFPSNYFPIIRIIVMFLALLLFNCWFFPHLQPVGPCPGTKSPVKWLPPPVMTKMNVALLCFNSVASNQLRIFQENPTKRSKKNCLLTHSMLFAVWFKTNYVWILFFWFALWKVFFFFFGSSFSNWNKF